MDEGVQAYIDGIPAGHRPLFDRVHGLVLTAWPDAEVVLSYDMPTYRVGRRRLHVGVWKHGVSMYGWRPDGDGGFVARHPELVHGKGTIRLRPGDADAIDDEDLLSLLRAALQA